MCHDTPLSICTQHAAIWRWVVRILERLDAGDGEAKPGSLPKLHQPHQNNLVIVKRQQGGQVPEKITRKTCQS